MMPNHKSQALRLARGRLRIAAARPDLRASCSRSSRSIRRLSAAKVRPSTGRGARRVDARFEIAP